MSVERPPTSVYASASAVDQQLNCSVEMTTQRHLFFFFFQRHFTRKKKTTLSFRDGHNGATQCQVSPKSAIHSKERKRRRPKSSCYIFICFATAKPFSLSFLGSDLTASESAGAATPAVCWAAARRTIVGGDSSSPLFFSLLF